MARHFVFECVFKCVHIYYVKVSSFAEPVIKKRPSRRFLNTTQKGLEPSTSGVTGRHSNQLSYWATGCIVHAQDKKVKKNLLYLWDWLFSCIISVETRL